jgi:hypothetical protein
MSHSAISTVTGQVFATAFFGGIDRGKVIQVHARSSDLPILLPLMVEDSDYGEPSTFENWLRWNCHRPDQKAPGMILFDPNAPPKVDSVPIEIQTKGN